MASENDVWEDYTLQEDKNIELKKIPVAEINMKLQVSEKGEKWQELNPQGK